MDDELLEFLDEPDEADAGEARRWKVLIVDDEASIHEVTTLALSGLTFDDRGIEFIHAYSGEEAKSILRDQPDIALTLLDVVMETDHAGLDVVEYVRETLGNKLLRIVLRTGQPGQAPEIEVIRRYDINDYKHKTELTRERLFTTIYTGLAAHRDLAALDANRRGLEKVIAASARIFELQSLEYFAQGVLEQLGALLFLDDDAAILQGNSVAAAVDEPGMRILAGSGRFASLAGSEADGALDADIIAKLNQARSSGWLVYDGREIVSAQSGSDRSTDFIFYLESHAPVDDASKRLIELFCKNVSIAWGNLQKYADKSE